LIGRVRPAGGPLVWILIRAVLALVVAALLGATVVAVPAIAVQQGANSTYDAVAHTYDAPAPASSQSAVATVGRGSPPGHELASREASAWTRGCCSAANGAPAAERLFTSRAVGVDSKLLGNSYARGESGLLNRTGSRLKFGWTSSGEFGGGWHLRLGIGRSPLNPNQARFHWDFGSTHVPNSVANDLLDVLRGLNGL
jgi:hypothetical protein